MGKCISTIMLSYGAKNSTKTSMVYDEPLKITNTFKQTNNTNYGNIIKLLHKKRIRRLATLL